MTKFLPVNVPKTQAKKYSIYYDSVFVRLSAIGFRDRWLVVICGKILLFRKLSARKIWGKQSFVHFICAASFPGLVRSGFLTDCSQGRKSLPNSNLSDPIFTSGNKVSLIFLRYVIILCSVFTIRYKLIKKKECRFQSKLVSTSMYPKTLLGLAADKRCYTIRQKLYYKYNLRQFTIV